MPRAVPSWLATDRTFRRRPVLGRRLPRCPGRRRHRQVRKRHCRAGHSGADVQCRVERNSANPVSAVGRRQRRATPAITRWLLPRKERRASRHGSKRDSNPLPRDQVSCSTDELFDCPAERRWNPGRGTRRGNRWYGPWRAAGRRFSGQDSGFGSWGPRGHGPEMNAEGEGRAGRKTSEPRSGRPGEARATRADCQVGVSRRVSPE